MAIRAIKSLAFRQRARKAFTAAVKELNGSEIYPRELAEHVDKLRPVISPESFPIVAMATPFKASQVQRSFREAVRNPRGVIGSSYTGAVIGIGSKPYAGFMQPLEEPDLFAAGKHVALYPHLFDPMDNFRQVTSFSRFILLKGNNGKAIVFLPSFKKSTEYSSKAGGKVDKFESEGKGRHYLHLQIGELIVDKMRKKGIQAELHVPAPEHVHLAAPPRDGNAEKGVRERATAPLEILDRHYNRGAVKIAGREIKTINLSRPKTESEKRQEQHRT